MWGSCLGQASILSLCNSSLLTSILVSQLSILHVAAKATFK